MLKLEVRPTSGLIPYERNTKVHAERDISAIAASITRFGFNDPIGIKPDGTVVEGHGRLLAAQRLGMENVPVLVLEGLTDAQIDRYRIAHNKIALNTSFNFEILVRTVAEIKELSDIHVTDMGFTAESYNNICSMFAPEKQTAPARTTVAHGHEYEIIWETKEQKDRFDAFMRAAKKEGTGFNGTDLLRHLEKVENMAVAGTATEGADVTI